MPFPSLSDAFLYAFDQPHCPDTADVLCFENAGNWKAIFPTIEKKLPKLRFEAGVRYPVVFGEDERVYLRQLGLAGIRQFKQNVNELLQANQRVFVFDAQKIECLVNNPSCVDDLIAPGRSIALFFRDGIDRGVSDYLRRKSNLLRFDSHSVADTSMSVIATRLSYQVLIESFKVLASELDGSEREALAQIRDDFVSDVAPELEDHFIEGSFGVGKLRELARRKIVSAVLKETTPAYSVKSGRDPIEFFRKELLERFKRYDLPVGYLSEVSPNLSFVVKSNKRFSELRID